MYRLIPVTLALCMLLACDASYTPKPRGYFRIDFPEHDYRVFDSAYPFTFEYPVYARIIPDTGTSAEKYWINIAFPRYRAMLHLSYKPVNGDLAGYLNDARSMVNKHIPKASAITQQEYINGGNRVFGLEYMIRGSDAASPYQFYLTDSTRHFLRGALYFNQVPNNDSLAPVIEFLKDDFRHLINTLRWAEAGKI